MAQPKKKQVSENITECPGCNEEFSRKAPPVTLPCGHNLCKPCLAVLRRRNGIVRCPIDNIDRKVQSSQINVDLLDFLELLKDEAVEIPKKRRGVAHQATQCDVVKPEENYQDLLLELKKKEAYLQRTVEYFENMYKQAEVQAASQLQARVSSLYWNLWKYP